MQVHKQHLQCHGLFGVVATIYSKILEHHQGFCPMKSVMLKKTKRIQRTHFQHAQQQKKKHTMGGCEGGV